VQATCSGNGPTGRVYYDWGRHLTFGDIKFLKEVGIEPRVLDDPFPRPLPPPLPPGPVIPALTKQDARGLLSLGVAWEHEPEPDFIPPRTLREYLTRCPTGIREAMGEAAKELGIALPGGGLDDLAQDIVVMFLDFAVDLEDIVEMYPFHPPVRPGERRSAHFNDYIRLRVRLGVETLLKHDLPSRGYC